MMNERTQKLDTQTSRWKPHLGGRERLKYDISRAGLPK